MKQTYTNALKETYESNMCVMSVTSMPSTWDQSEQPIKETLYKKCEADCTKGNLQKQYVRHECDLNASYLNLIRGTYYRDLTQEMWSTLHKNEPTKAVCASWVWPQWLLPDLNDFYLRLIRETYKRQREAEMWSRPPQKGTYTSNMCVMSATSRTLTYGQSEKRIQETYT